MAVENEGKAEELLVRGRPFLGWLVEWESRLPVVGLGEYLAERGHGPTGAAICSVDVTRGFCESGALASQRVGAIVEPIARLFQHAHELGVRHFVLTQDTHRPDAEEFGEWPPHGVAGTPEAETVPALARLPFADEFVVMPKNSIDSSMGTGLDAWLDVHGGVKELIAVGDCTDLCVYQLAMHLKLRSNARGLGCRVAVPADCVETYDLPVEVAQQIGAMPHDGDLIHLVFLYHLALNGVKVVRRFE